MTSCRNRTHPTPPHFSCWPTPIAIPRMFPNSFAQQCGHQPQAVPENTPLNLNCQHQPTVDSDVCHPTLAKKQYPYIYSQYKARSEAAKRKTRQFRPPPPLLPMLLDDRPNNTVPHVLDDDWEPRAARRLFFAALCLIQQAEKLSQVHGAHTVRSYSPPGPLLRLSEQSRLETGRGKGQHQETVLSERRDAVVLQRRGEPVQLPGALPQHQQELAALCWGHCESLWRAEHRVPVQRPMVLCRCGSQAMAA